VQERELARLAGVDRDRHRRADRIPRLVVPAAAAPAGAGRHARDARIAATAARDGRVLVTDDRDLRERAAAMGVTAWDTARLLDALDRMDAPA
jgi:predicted nucleic acid-binding protein